MALQLQPQLRPAAPLLPASAATTFPAWRGDCSSAACSGGKQQVGVGPRTSPVGSAAASRDALSRPALTDHRDPGGGGVVVVKE